MPEKGWTSVTIRNETKERLVSYAKRSYARSKSGPRKFGRFPLDEAIQKLLAKRKRR